MNSPPTVAPWAAKIGRSSPNTVVVVARQGSSCSRCDVDHRALSWSTVGGAPAATIAGRRPTPHRRRSRSVRRVVGDFRVGRVNGQAALQGKGDRIEYRQQAVPIAVGIRLDTPIIARMMHDPHPRTGGPPEDPLIGMSSTSPTVRSGRNSTCCPRGSTNRTGLPSTRNVPVSEDRDGPRRKRPLVSRTNSRECPSSVPVPVSQYPHERRRVRCARRGCGRRRGRVPGVVRPATAG